jgi:F-type H+-transporting ATPase subunit epsilon
VARATYQLNIVTPEKSVFDGAVSSTTLPGEAGYLGVWAHHAPMVASLVPGVLSVHEGASEASTRQWAIGGGFAQVSENKMILVVDSAEDQGEIDVARAEAALARAKEHLREALTDKSIDAERAQAAKERAEARLKVAYKVQH